MLTAIIDFTQNMSVAALLISIVVVMVRRDIKDKNKPRIVETESDETKSVTEVVYFEGMSFDDKYKQIAVELGKIDKLIPNDKALDNLRTALTTVQHFQRTIDKSFGIEHAELRNAVSWLEKPLVTRGRYKPTDYDGRETVGNVNAEDVEKTIRKLTSDEALDGNSDMNDDVKDEPDAKVSQKIQRPARPKILFKMPDISLETLSEITNFADRLRLLADVWSRKFFGQLLECVKIWFAVCMTVRHSTCVATISERALDAIGTFSRTLIAVHTEVNGEDDLSVFTFVVFPEPRELTADRIRHFSSRITAKVESLFQYYKRLFIEVLSAYARDIST